jgi:hypothetical protein
VDLEAPEPPRYGGRCRRELQLDLVGADQCGYSASNGRLDR